MFTDSVCVREREREGVEGGRREIAKCFILQIIEQKRLARSSLSVYLFGYRGNQKLYSGDFFK